MVHGRIPKDRVHVLCLWSPSGEGAKPVPEIKTDPSQGLGLLHEARGGWRIRDEGSFRLHTCKDRINTNCLHQEALQIQYRRNIHYEPKDIGLFRGL